jgi:hypothetical protein
MTYDLYEDILSQIRYGELTRTEKHAQLNRVLGSDAAQNSLRYLWWCDPSHDIPYRVFIQGKEEIDGYIDREIEREASREMPLLPS